MNETKTKKEFGKLTADQLLTALQWLPEIETIQADVQKTLLADPDSVAKMAPKGFRWSGAYELTFEEHLARIVILIGKADFIAAAARSADPAEVLMADIGQDQDVEALQLGVVGEAHGAPYLIGLLWALIRSFEAVALYGRYIHQLLAEARSDHPDRDKALFSAIRVDPAVVTGETAARRISTALVMDDRPFLDGLQLAMQGKTGDQVAYLRKFRLAIKMLSESGGIGNSPTALARRLVDLGIYPDGPSAVKNAAELIRKAKKANAI